VPPTRRRGGFRGSEVCDRRNGIAGRPLDEAEACLAAGQEARRCNGEFVTARRQLASLYQLAPMESELGEDEEWARPGHRLVQRDDAAFPRRELLRDAPAPGDELDHAALPKNLRLQELVPPSHLLLEAVEQRARRVEAVDVDEDADLCEARQQVEPVVRPCQ
jgi:hypothetical protein